MKTLKQVTDELAAKSKALHQVFEEAGSEMDFDKVQCLGEMDTAAKLEKVQAMNKELDDLEDERKKLVELDSTSKKAASIHELLNNPEHEPLYPQQGTDTEQKTLGQLIMEKKDSLRPNGPAIEIPFDVKTLFQTSAGWAPESTRIPRVELYPLRTLVVVDYIPQVPTTQAAVVYMQETTATLNAAEKAEGAAYAESAFALTEQSETVRKVTSHLPVTDEQLADVPAAEAYLNNRLSYDLRRRLDLQVLEGDGNAPNLKGTVNIGGSLQTQAKGDDPSPDAIYKGFDKVRTVGFAEPSVLFINPADWQPIRLLRTADGIYIFGNPTDAGPERIWGKPVVQTTAKTANTAVAGDYIGFATLFIRSGVEVSMGYVGDNFKEGKKTIRADIRCAMVHFRTAAFVTVTGL